MSEKRKQQRFEVHPQNFCGELTIQIGGQDTSVSKVRDLSPFGLGVQTKEELQDGVQARLQYQHESMLVSVGGTVVWTKSSNRHGTDMDCKVGIVLQPEDMENNLKFYHLLMQASPATSST